MRDSDAGVDALVGELRRRLMRERHSYHDDKDSGGGRLAPEPPALGIDGMADRIAEPVHAGLEKRIPRFTKEAEDKKFV